MGINDGSELLRGISRPTTRENRSLARLADERREGSVRFTHPEHGDIKMLQDCHNPHTRTLDDPECSTITLTPARTTAFGGMEMWNAERLLGARGGSFISRKDTKNVAPLLFV